MKRVLIILVTAICMFACSKTQPVDNDNIIIEVCGQTSPAWLINEINSIVEPVQPNYRPVSVYSTIVNDVTYVLVTDMVNNALAHQFRFFLCSGETIPYDTAEYNELIQKYANDRESFILLWSNSNF
jgi:hypothetical protein